MLFIVLDLFNGNPVDVSGIITHSNPLKFCPLFWTPSNISNNIRQFSDESAFSPEVGEGIQVSIELGRITPQKELLGIFSEQECLADQVERVSKATNPALSKLSLPSLLCLHSPVKLRLQSFKDIIHRGSIGRFVVGYDVPDL